jgi:nucleotide-binding universal stress UspA family protein
MYGNVLVGVDGEAGGRDAIALGRRLIAPDGRLTLAHVRYGEVSPAHAVIPGMVHEEREESEALLERERADAAVAAELLGLVATKPAAGLHRQAEEQGADLLVVGASRRGAFGRAMLGDDTRASLNGASCAVAIAAHGYAATTAIADVGVAYNGSPESVAALAKARELAAATGARIHALEVVAIPTYGFTGVLAPGLGDTVEEMITAAQERLAALDGVDGQAVYGLAGEELAALSDRLDILVVGSRSYGPVRRLVLGSTSSYLQRHARSSLLVLVRPAAAAA